MMSYSATGMLNPATAGARHPVLLFPLLAICPLMLAAQKLPAEDNPNGSESSPVRWAIVVHGGAGSDPESWDGGKRLARETGLEQALKVGRSLLADGGQAVDVVEQVIRVFEDDASFNAGRGAVLTTDGRAELDASIMDGRTLACGAVAGVTRPKNPISAARRVMETTPHVLLAGPGADAFAQQQQLELVDPSYFLGRAAPDRNRDAAPPGGGSGSTHFGTVGCVVLDAERNLAAGTSTGGTAKKLPGRIGDSPIVGAGTYAANGVCGVSGTGIGEEYIRNAVAYDVAAQMRYADRTLEQAVTDNITERLQPDSGGLIAVGADGRIVMQHNTPGMSCGGADSRGRFELHLKLDQSGR